MGSPVTRLSRSVSSLASGVKGFVMQWASRARWGFLSLGGTVFDYAASAGDGRGNAAVMACVRWIQRALPEAPVLVTMRDRSGEMTPQHDHALAQLLDRPNPYYSGLHLWAATVADLTLSGNAYWLKVRSGANRVVELWWIPSTMIEPWWPTDGTTFIERYDYSVDGRPIAIDPADVVHFRDGFDPNNIRKGLSPIGSLLREIATDNEAANFTASLLRNMGVPGVVISPETGTTATEGQMEEAKAKFSQKFGGDHRGEPLVMRGPTRVTVLSFNPEQMNLKGMRRVPEERISALIGIPAAVVGLGVGLEQTKVGATMGEMREQAYESCLIPLQRLLAAEMQTQLVPDFGNPVTLRVAFDLTQVRVLQQDENDLHKRLREDLLAGGIYVNEFRARLGYDPLPDGDVLYLPSTVQPIDPADLLAVPEPRMQVTDVTPVAPPAKFRALAGGKRAAPEKFVPLGAGEPFDPLPDRLTFTDADKAAVGAMWDETFSGEPEEGLLDAVVEA